MNCGMEPSLAATKSSLWRRGGERDEDISDGSLYYIPGGPK